MIFGFILANYHNFIQSNRHVAKCEFNTSGCKIQDKR